MGHSSLLCQIHNLNYFISSSCLFVCFYVVIIVFCPDFSHVVAISNIKQIYFNLGNYGSLPESQPLLSTNEKTPKMSVRTFFARSSSLVNLSSLSDKFDPKGSPNCEICHANTSFSKLMIQLS